MQQELGHTDVNILSSEIKGDKALLLANGRRAAEKSKRTIDTIKEHNRWKVNLE